KPVSEVGPGDVLRGHPGHHGILKVTAPPAHPGAATQISGKLAGPAGRTDTWTYHSPPGEEAQVSFIPPGGPLTGPGPAAADSPHAHGRAGSPQPSTPAAAATPDAAAGSSPPDGDGSALTAEELETRQRATLDRVLADDPSNETLAVTSAL